MRTFIISEEVNESDISANMDQGILTTNTDEKRRIEAEVDSDKVIRQ